MSVQFSAAEQLYITKSSEFFEYATPPIAHLSAAQAMACSKYQLVTSGSGDISEDKVKRWLDNGYYSKGEGGECATKFASLTPRDNEAFNAEDALLQLSSADVRVAHIPELSDGSSLRLVVGVALPEKLSKAIGDGSIDSYSLEFRVRHLQGFFKPLLIPVRRINSMHLAVLFDLRAAVPLPGEYLFQLSEGLELDIFFRAMRKRGKSKVSWRVHMFSASVLPSGSGFLLICGIQHAQALGAKEGAGKSTFCAALESCTMGSDLMSDSNIPRGESAEGVTNVTLQVPLAPLKTHWGLTMPSQPRPTRSVLYDRPGLKGQGHETMLRDMIDVLENGVVVKGKQHTVTAMHVMYDMKDPGFRGLLTAGGARERASNLQQHCGLDAVLLPVNNLLQHAAHPTIVTVTRSSLLLPQEERCGAVFDGPATDKMRRDLAFKLGTEDDWRITFVDLDEHAYPSTHIQLACLSLAHKMQRAVDAHFGAELRQAQRALNINRNLIKADEQRRRALEHAAQHCLWACDSEDSDDEDEDEKQTAAAPSFARGLDVEAGAAGLGGPAGAILRSTADPFSLGRAGVLGGEAMGGLTGAILRSTADPLPLGGFDVLDGEAMESPSGANLCSTADPLPFGGGGVLGGEAMDGLTVAILRSTADPLPLRHDDGTLHWQNEGHGLTLSEDGCDEEAGSAAGTTDDSVEEEQTSGEPAPKRPRADSPWTPLAARLRQRVTGCMFGSFSATGDANLLDSV